MKKITLGIIAHVDSGKTTLSEALMYETGAIRKLGRVDKGDTLLDGNSMERKRGITIYSKQAAFEYGESRFTLLDTPGHSDFSAEMERTLQVLDYAILLISAADGIKGQSETLWRLLAEYNIPVFIFFNKMDQLDQKNSGRLKLLAEVKSRFSDGAIDFGSVRDEKFYDQLGMCGEEAMEEFLETGKVSEDLIRQMIAERKVFPCFFGAALRQEGIEGLLKGLDELTLQEEYPEEFGARAFKIIRDDSGKRLTMMKITGGVLKNKAVLPDGGSESKVNQIRVYFGDKFTAANEACAGDICAVDGLKESFAGQGFGFEAETILPILAPVLSYRVVLPYGADPVLCLPYFKTLEEESPELKVRWDEEHKEISVQVMGQVQLEILTSVLDERFNLDVSFDTGKVLYKETICAPVTGVGHFEPLRHYAEVHLRLEPLPLGSGIIVDSEVSTDVLAKNWQRLIITHICEKEHRGVLTGSPLTDVKITITAGRASARHTDGGDFRQATYRAIRQGLMMAENSLLEPYYRFILNIPSDCVGRAMTDMERMGAQFQAPMIEENEAIMTGRVPVAALGDYARELAVYTKGLGRISVAADGYGKCHNPQEVIEERGYDPTADLRNTPDSVFCANGSGFIVPYDQVYDYMHIPFEGEEGGYEAAAFAGKEREERWLGTEEVDAIISRISGANASSAGRRGWKIRKKKYAGFGSKDGAVSPDSRMHGSSNVKKVAIFPPEQADYLLVDGYNVIFAWEELADLARANMDSARISLEEILCNFQAVMGFQVIVVYDAYRVQGHVTEYFDRQNIHIVFTREAETADQYIEKFAHDNGKKYRVAVVTSDGLEQIIIRGQGCALVSSREFRKWVNDHTSRKL